MYPRLKNKTVLITGASAGIGAACATKFAEQHSKLILFARRSDRLESLKAELEKSFSVAVHIDTVDVRSQEQVIKALNSLPEEFKAIDILVNNAGLALGADVTYETTQQIVDTVIDTNVKGIIWFIQSIVPGMIERNSGHIINVSSIAGYEAYKGGSIYCASKHAVKAITTSLRKELIATPIRVSSVSPGMVNTEFSLVRFNDEEKAKNCYKGLPSGPLLAEDIAEDILYCASRPPHVQVAEIITLTTNQGSTEIIHRE